MNQEDMPVFFNDFMVMFLTMMQTAYYTRPEYAYRVEEVRYYSEFEPAVCRCVFSSRNLNRSLSRLRCLR